MAEAEEETEKIRKGSKMGKVAPPQLLRFTLP